MKIILLGNAQSHIQALGVLNEDLLLKPGEADKKLNLYNLKIDHIEIVNGEKVVFIKENVENKNLLNG